MVGLRLSTHMHHRINPMSIHTIQSIKIDMTSLEVSKSNLLATEKEILSSAIVSQIAEKYSDYTQFYTDGSLDPDTGRASSAYTSVGIKPTIERGVRITDNVSSTHAELAAI